jgi:hypothetical protein
MRMTMAAPLPQKTACFCCFSGHERAARAITTALSTIILQLCAHQV